MKQPLQPSAADGKSDLAGSWIQVDEYMSSVEFIVSLAGDAFNVRAVDTYDGEEADIFETAWNGETLSFAAHWNTTGRFARYRIKVLAKNRISVTYTYTDTELWERKRKA